MRDRVERAAGRHRWPAALLSLALGLGPSPASGIEARVRAALASEGPAWVGQRVVIQVDLLSDGVSFGSQVLRLPDVPGAILMRDASAALYLSERVDGETWQVQRYSLSLFPRRAAEIRIPPIAASFEVSAGYGQPAQAFERTTQPLVLHAQLPPGVEDAASLISTPQLDVEVDWQPRSEHWVVGDALTRTLRRRGLDVSGMAFAPLPTPEIDGLAVYTRPPDVADRTQRGEFVGERVESVTFVAQRPGTFQIPGVVLRWWDPGARELREETIDAFALKVAPNPALGPSSLLGYHLDRLARGHPLLALALLAALGSALAWVWLRRRRLWAIGRGWRARRAQSEAAHFHRLRRTCREGRPGPAYDALWSWLGSLDPPVRTTGAALGDDALRQRLQELQQALVAPATAWVGAGLERELRRVRRERAQRGGRARRSALPPLNPVHSLR